MEILLLDLFDSLFLLHCCNLLNIMEGIGLLRRMKNNDIPYYFLHCKMVLLLLFVLCRCIDTFICFITHKSVDSDLLLYGFPVDY